MSSTGLDFKAGEALYRRIFWRLIPVLFIAYVVAYLDRVNIGFAKLQMLGDLHFSSDVYALGAGIFFYGYALCETPSNMLMSRLGARVWIARIMLTWGIVSVAMAFTGSIAHVLHIDARWVFYTLRLLMGVFEAGFFPGVVLYLNYWYPTQRQGQVLSTFMLALPISLVLGGPISGGVMSAFAHAQGFQGWQWLFVVEGVPALLLAVVVFFTLPSRIDDASWLTAQEKAFLTSRLSFRPAAHKMAGIGAALRDLNFWLMIGIVLTTNTGFYGLSFWLPSIIRGAGIDSTLEIGLLTAIPYVASAIAMYFNGVHSRCTGERRLHMAVPVFIAGVCMMLSATFAHEFRVSFVLMGIAATGLISMMPIIWSVPGGVLAPACLATGIGLMGTIGQLAGVLGAYITNFADRLTGHIANGNYVLGALLVLAAVFTLAIKKSHFDRIDADPAADAWPESRHTWVKSMSLHSETASSRHAG